VRTGREQLGPEMLADLEVVLRNDGERQHLYATHKRTHDGLPLGILERFVFCLTAAYMRAFRLGCGPINELRLLALEDAERHGKLEALYHKCGFRTAGAARFECDTDHTYRHVPMTKVLEPLVFVCVPRSLAHSQPQEEQALGLCHATNGLSTQSERSTPEGFRSTYPGQDSCIGSDTPSEPFA
jgi:hypothetical protein